MTKLRTVLLALAAVAALTLTGCSHKSDTVSHNISNAADQYQVFRQIVVYNTFTDKYILEVDGYCALGNHDPANEVSYTCKVSNSGSDNDRYIKDIIHVSDNAVIFEHQLHPINVSSTYFKVTLRPLSVVPSFQVQ